MPTTTRDLLRELANRSPRFQFAVFVALTVLMGFLFVTALLKRDFFAVPVFFGLVAGVLGVRTAKERIRMHREVQKD